MERRTDYVSIRISGCEVPTWFIDMITDAGCMFIMDYKNGWSNITILKPPS